MVFLKQVCIGHKAGRGAESTMPATMERVLEI
jgi:hypothetical protein